jgi:hypothetical protein
LTQAGSSHGLPAFRLSPDIPHGRTAFKNTFFFAERCEFRIFRPCRAGCQRHCYGLVVDGGVGLRKREIHALTEQVLSFVAMAKDNAAKDPNFGQAAGEDLMEDLVRRAQLMNRLENPWSGGVRAVAQSPLMRIELDVPSRACRRLAIFFGKNADDLKLAKMETRKENGTWQLLDATTPIPNYPAINKACGEDQGTTLALTLQLR